MFTLGHKVFVGVCVVVGLLSAVFAGLTTEMVDNLTLTYFGWAVVVGLLVASGWGICSLVRNQLTGFTKCAAAAFAASATFQVMTSFDSLVHFMSPDIFIFVVTCVLLAFGVKYGLSKNTAPSA